MKILFYKGKYGSFIDWLICLFTFSKYSHCELWIDGYCYSSSLRDNGVRKKKINYENSNHWDVFDLKIDNKYINFHKELIFYFFKKTINFKYDLKAVLFYPFINPKFTDSKEKYYCSEWIIDAFKRTGFLRTMSPHLTPGQLFKFLKYLNKI